MCAHTLMYAKLTCDKKCNIHIYNLLKFLQKTQITAMLTRHTGDMYILFEIVAEDNFYSYFCKVMQAEKSLQESDFNTKKHERYSMVRPILRLYAD